MNEYIVKVKDYDQDITHTIKQIADTKSEANVVVLKILRKMLGTNNFEIV